MRIATFNVNSINVRLNAVLSWLEGKDDMILGLQETKVKDDKFPLEPFTEAGWHVEFHGQASYNGVALISKSPPDKVWKTLGDEVKDKQARLIAGQYGEVVVVNTYVPQGSEVGSEKFAYKLEWLSRFQEFLNRNFEATQQLAWVGDYNIAPEDIDVYAPDFFEDDVGAHPDERAILEELRGWGFTDCFRKLHPDEKKQFTFFDYRTRDSVKYKKGWRIDHVWVTDSLLSRLKECEIDMEPRLLEKASDHTPLWASFKDE